ncbi:MAG: SDR family oxidoreductase [Rubrivivax sp.]|nr:SDR family oxidoreductase [Rubrivivax sp.]
MKTPPLVLVVGATGALGRPVVRRLLAAGVPVRALCRHPAQAADLVALGAEVVAGDLIDAASLQRACVGVQSVLACAHGLLGRGRWRSEAVDDTGHRALIAASQAAGVQRFVYVSALLAGPDSPLDFGRTKHAIEQAVAASGLPHAILRPSAFMEHHVHRFNGEPFLKHGRAVFFGPASKPRNFVAADDVARIAVHALLDDPLPFERLDIGGPDHASNAEVAALYARLAGLPYKATHLPAGLARALARVVRPLHPGVARILGLMGLPDEALPEHFDGAAALAQRFGFRMTRLQAFVQARVQAHVQAQVPAR